MFKRKNLQNTVGAGAIAIATAMAGMGVATLSTTAQAVNIAHDGLGQTLIFPYYTARNGWATYFNITNTSDKTVVIKVRWSEGVNSRDARDFNVVLSPYDVWTVVTNQGIKTDAAEENKNVAVAMTADNSCTVPQLLNQAEILKRFTVQASGNPALKGVPLTNLAYTGVDADTGSDKYYRAAEGYFTVYEMGVVDTSTDLGKEIARLALHGGPHTVGGSATDNPGQNDGVPYDCSALETLFVTKTQTELSAAMLAPENVLKGRGVLINGADGIATGYDPVTMANTNTLDDVYRKPSDPLPNLNTVNPPQAVAVNDETGFAGNIPSVNSGLGIRGVDAVTALLNRTGVINDYNVGGLSETDWILTFPTKAHYVDEEIPTRADGTVDWVAGTTSGLNFALNPGDLTNQVGAYPFNDNVEGEQFGTVQAGKSCFTVGIDMYDREEYTKTGGGGGRALFSPKEPGQDTGSKLCYEANILSFGESNVFGSSLRKSVPTDPGTSGWAKVNFGEVPGAATTTYNPLPVIGLRLEARKRPGDAAKSFGFSSEHAYTRPSQ